MRNFLLTFLIFLGTFSISAGSGGPLSKEQAAYNVTFYQLDLEIFPDSKSISGSALCTASILEPLNTFVLDLDSGYLIDSILYRRSNENFKPAAFTHSQGKINITPPSALIAGDIISARIFYKGKPRISKQPPWDDGFVFSTSQNGKPWIGLATEGAGGDLWFPCKDHPTDEPDSAALNFTVPKPLTCVSNGTFIDSTDNGNTTTFRWFVSSPINNYNITFYAAVYMLIEDKYQSVNGEFIPFYFWILPENYNKALNQLKVFREEFDFLESICGPFPFGKMKHGFANSPYWGMEHQTIVAYGSNFMVNDWGYDFIHFHEMAHEWWGNLVTAKDWSDVWIHEGIAVYTEALYVEAKMGQTSLYQFMDMQRSSDTHSYALAPRESMTSDNAFFFLNPYKRGAYVMHTLRYYLGDENFFRLLKRWAYPDSSNLNGETQCRIVSTDDLKNQAEVLTGIDLDPFFEAFFRQKSFPLLKVARGDSEASFTWITQNNIPLDLDVPVTVNGNALTINMENGKGTAAIALKDELRIDPNGWIIMTTKVVTEVNENDTPLKDFRLGQNYPNPFNPSTTIPFEVPETSDVTVRIYDSISKEIGSEQLRLESGGHSYVFHSENLSSGVYFYEVEAETDDGKIFRDIRRMVLMK